MMLLLDAGNTLVKWGVRRDGAWHAQGVVAYQDLAALSVVLEHYHPLCAYGVNVAGPALEQSLVPLMADHGLVIEWLRAGQRCSGVQNSYRDPQRLGADRWAALVGARALHRGTCVVVCAGTATTIDVLGADGVFRGGLIVPGERLMRRALSDNTAQLPFADGAFVDYPCSTEDAIWSGCRLAQLGAIERMFASVATEPGALCLLSGGAAEQLVGALRVPCRPVDNLVLEGLARMAEQRQTVAP